MKVDEDIVLIAGPTASGKTSLAIEIAQANDAEIINTDSMQVYTDLAIVTARPSADELALAPHHLFGHLDAARHYSVAQWLSDVEPLLDNYLNGGKKVVFVGGTGLYFNALTQGLSPVPQISPEIRDKWRSSDDLTAEQLHVELMERDPEYAFNLLPSDRQRILRGLEVMESTGKSLLDWQKELSTPLIGSDISVKRLLLMPERSMLHERINLRFDLMMEAGALDEVQHLLSRKLSPELPAMKAIGVPQLAGFLAGDLSFSDAVERAKAASRQYAKRQSTWFRNSFDAGWETL